MNSEGKMKSARSLSVSVMLLLISISPTFAGSVHISWQPNIETDLKSYNLYFGQSSRAYGPPLSVGNETSYTLDGLENGTTYYLALTAIDNMDNESGFSSEIEITVSEETPVELNLLGINVASKKAYEVRQDLAVGQLAYIDRQYTIQNVPEMLKGYHYIMTANDDKTIDGDAFLSFLTNKHVTVYVAHDDRITMKPNWLKGFQDTGLALVTDVPMSIYTRNFAAGKVTLGGNGGNHNNSMYSIIVQD
jgi:hypothetical protein